MTTCEWRGCSNPATEKDGYRDSCGQHPKLFHVIVSGDWLMNEAYDYQNRDAGVKPYSLGYAAVIRPGETWSGGVVPHVSKHVAERIVTEQAKYFERYGADFEADVLTWEGEQIRLTRAGDDDQVSEPDAEGRYDVGFGWCWSSVEASECDEVVTMTEVEALSLIMLSEEMYGEEAIEDAEYTANNNAAREILGSAFTEALAQDAVRYRTSPGDFGDCVRRGPEAVEAVLTRIKQEVAT